MACLHSVKQEKMYVVQIYRETIHRSQVKDVAYWYFTRKFLESLSVLWTRQFSENFVVFTLCLITVKKLLKGYSSSDLSTFCFYLQRTLARTSVVPFGSRVSFWSLFTLKMHDTRTWNVMRYFKRDIVLQVVSKEMVVRYLLASLSVNVDGDWLIRICAKFLLIKEK